jgi:hypothetical protein
MRRGNKQMDGTTMKKLAALDAWYREHTAT